MGVALRLKKEQADGIVEAVRLGNTREAAALIVGVKPSKLNAHLAKDTDAAQKLLARIEQAEGEAEADLVACILGDAQAGVSWKAAAWLLERRNPDTWGTMLERREARGDEDEGEDEAPKSPLAEFDELAERRAGRG